MIKFNIRGENIEVTDSIRSYVEEKISKLEKYFTENQELTAHVNLKVYAEKTSKVEVTIPAKNITLRAEDTSQELYGSIDLVQEKLERQIRKYKTKVQKKRNNIATGKVFETFVELSAEQETIRRRLGRVGCAAQAAIRHLGREGRGTLAATSAGAW